MEGSFSKSQIADLMFNVCCCPGPLALPFCLRQRLSVITFNCYRRFRCSQVPYEEWTLLQQAQVSLHLEKLKIFRELLEVTSSSAAACSSKEDSSTRLGAHDNTRTGRRTMYCPFSLTMAVSSVWEVAISTPTSTL